MKLGRRGTTTLEFAILVPPLMILLFGSLEFGRMLWTWQALQLASDQTARCVAISGTACTTPSTFAQTAAANFGVIGSSSVQVQVANTPPAVTSATACSPPGSNTATQVTITLTFTSPVSLLIPALAQTLTTTSCYPWTGK